MKDDLSQNNIRKYDISFKPSEKVVFSKRAQEIHENMIFSVYMTYGCYKCGTTPLCQKKKKRKSKTILSRKNTPKGELRSRLVF